MLLTTHFPHEVSSASVRLAEMVNRLSIYSDIEKIKVIVYNPLLECEDNNLNIETSDKVEVVRYYLKFIPKSFHYFQVMNPFTFLIWIFISIKETIVYKPDLLISSTPPFLPVIASCFVSKIFKKPFCIDVRDDWTKIANYLISDRSIYVKLVVRLINGIMFNLLLISYNSAQLISTVNEPIAKIVSHQTNSKIPTITVHNGINTSEIEKIYNVFNKEKVLLKNTIPYESDNKYIVYAGLLGGYYCPEIIFNAMKNMIDLGHNIYYIIIGEDLYCKKLKEITIKIGIENNVCFVGRKNHSEVIELLLASDIAFYALVSNYPQANHAISTKILEYIGCKLPILAIVDKNTFISKLISKNEIGITLSWDKTEHLEKSLAVLLESEMYLNNLINYYPNFIKVYNREINNDLLYRNMKNLMRDRLSDES